MCGYRLEGNEGRVIRREGGEDGEKREMRKKK